MTAAWTAHRGRAQASAALGWLLACAGCSTPFSVQVSLEQTLIESTESTSDGFVARGHGELLLVGQGNAGDDPTTLWLMDIGESLTASSFLNIEGDVPNVADYFPLTFLPTDRVSVPLELVLTRHDQSWCNGPAVLLRATIYNETADARHDSFSGGFVAFETGSCP